MSVKAAHRAPALEIAGVGLAPGAEDMAMPRVGGRGIRI